MKAFVRIKERKDGLIEFRAMEISDGKLKIVYKHNDDTTARIYDMDDIISFTMVECDN